MSTTSRSLFDALYDALARKSPGIALADGTASHFQFMDTPCPAAWHTGQDARAFLLADSCATRLDGFFMPGGSFSEAYRNYVQALEPRSGASSARFCATVAQSANLNRALVMIDRQARAAFQDYRTKYKGTQLTYLEWLADPRGGHNYQTPMRGFTQLRQSHSRLQALALRAYDPDLAEAQLALAPWSESMSISHMGESRDVAQTAIEGDLAGDIRRWDARRRVSHDLDVTLTGHETLAYVWRTALRGTPRSLGWGACTPAGMNTQRIASDPRFKLRLLGSGLNSYRIRRGSWFKPALLNPRARLVAGSPFNSDSFFGEHGSLHQVLDEILVIHRPMVQLTLSTQVYVEEIARHVSASVHSADLLGLRFALDGLASLQPVSDGQTTTITLQAPSTQRAQVLGMLSRLVWNGHGAEAPKPAEPVATETVSDFGALA